MDSTIALGIKEEKEFTLKNWHLYLFVTILYLIVALVNDKFIMTRDVYQQLFSDKMEGYRIDDYYQLIKKFTFYAYLIIPVVTWLKITFIALLLQTPLMLKNIEVSFKETFRIAAIANLPLILRGVVKFTILIFTPRVEYTNDLLSSIPGSITNFISKANYSQVSYNFLSNINIYCFCRFAEVKKA